MEVKVISGTHDGGSSSGSDVTGTSSSMSLNEMVVSESEVSSMSN